jgi:hypothetical protein
MGAQPHVRRARHRLAGRERGLQSLALLVYAGVVWLACHLFVVLYGSPARRFGAAYDTYRAQVPDSCPGFTDPDG